MAIIHRLRVAWVALLLGCVLLAVPASGQTTGTAEVNRELHRAELAWRSGGSLLEAKARIDRVLEQYPDNLAARKLRAYVLLGLRRPAAALDDARRAAALTADAEAYLLVCEAARLSGRDAEARAALDQVSALAFDNAPLHVRTAWNAAELGLLDRAEAFARIALQQDPSLPAAYLQLARIFVQQGQRGAAASVLVRSLTLGVLDARAIEDDDRLRPLLSHPDVRALLR